MPSVREGLMGLLMALRDIRDQGFDASDREIANQALSDWEAAGPLRDDESIRRAIYEADPCADDADSIMNAIDTHLLDREKVKPARVEAHDTQWLAALEARDARVKRLEEALTANAELFESLIRRARDPMKSMDAGSVVDARGLEEDSEEALERTRAALGEKEIDRG